MKNPIVIVLIVLVLAGGVWFASTKNSSKKEEVKPLKIGVLFKGDNFKKVADGFMDGFNENLAATDRRVEFVVKDEAGTDQKDFDASAQMLIDNKVDLILAIGAEPVIAAKKLTAENKIPVIFELGVNPVKQGFVASLQKPGSNMTGIDWQVEALTGKRLELLLKIDPRVKRITVFRKKGSGVMNTALEYLTPAAKQLGVAVTIKEVGTIEDLQAALLQTTRANTDAIFYAPEPFIQRNGEIIIKQALKEKLPIIFYDEYFARLGSLASYGANFSDAGKQGARLAKKILFDGQSPADMPIESVSQIDLILNRVSANAIGLQFAPDLVPLATTIIEK